VTTTTLARIPVYELRLVQSRRPLRVSERHARYAPMAARALHSLIGLADREHMACLFVDAQMAITGAHIIAIGGQSSIGTIEPVTVFRAALVSGARGIILGHNHPSGDPSPSEQDKGATTRLLAASCVVGVSVLDHVIVTRDPRTWESMFETCPALGWGKEVPSP
jgi:DNA repair protein RadC